MDGFGSGLLDGDNQGFCGLEGTSPDAHGAPRPLPSPPLPQHSPGGSRFGRDLKSHKVQVPNV